MFYPGELVHSISHWNYVEHQIAQRSLLDAVVGSNIINMHILPSAWKEAIDKIQSASSRKPSCNIDIVGWCIVSFVRIFKFCMPACFGVVENWNYT